VLGSQVTRVSGFPPLALYATHDNTLVNLLIAMDIWDGQWPTYAEALIVEAYRRKMHDGKEQGFVRILRRGKPLNFSACGQRTICTKEEFDGFGKPWLRDERKMDLYCRGTSGLVSTSLVAESSWFGNVQQLPWLFVACTLSALLGGLIALRIQKTRAVLPSLDYQEFLLE